MNIDLFLTTLISQPAANAAAAKPAPAQAGSAGFLNLLLSSLIGAPQDTAIMPKTPSAAISPQGDAVNNEATPGSAKIPLVSPEVAQQALPVPDMEILREELLAKIRTASVIEGVDIELGTALPATNRAQEQIIAALALNRRAFDDALRPLTDGIITLEETENGSPRLLNALLLDADKDRKGILDKLSQILDMLKKLTQDNNGAALATANFTPEQITRIQAKISALIDKGGAEDGEDDEEIAAIVLSLINISPPQAQPETIFIPGGLGVSSGPLEKFGVPLVPSSRPAGIVTGEKSPSSPAELRSSGTEPDLNQITGGAASSRNNGDIFTLNNSVKNPASFVDQGVFEPESLLNDALSGNNLVLADGFEWNSYFDDLGLHLPGFNLTGPGNFAQSLIHASSAAAPHPATQLVAATLQKSAADGENKNILLQLDPPDLGRVEVRLSFGKDKTVKAVVLAERSETVTMLQRDGYALERALYSAGLDADGSSLSFELAGDGYFSEHGGGENNGSGGGTLQKSSDEIIESKMTWQVDPETGHMRYDILA